MNKTVTVNISGLVFYIEEHAYEALSNYLNAIKALLKNTQGKDEIIADVELRIAELFTEKISDKKQVITAEMVDELIAQLGQPQDYEVEDETNPIGVLDEESIKEGGKKRIFRNSDDKLVGGILSGFAAYFGHDPLWWRIGFTVTVFLGYGSPILVYLILWLIIPEAKTRAEKLQMHGEDITIENLKKRFEAETNQLKDRIDNLNLGKSSSALKNTIQEIVQFFLTVFGALFKIIGRLFGVVLIFLGLTLSVALIILLINQDHIFSINNNHSYMSASFLDMLDFMVKSPENKTMLIWGFGIFAIIFTSTLLYAGIKLLFKISTSLLRGVTSGLSLVAFIALVIGFVGLANIMTEFKADVQIPEKTILTTQSDTLYIDAFDDLIFSNHLRSGGDGMDLIKIEKNQFIAGNVKLDIRTSGTPNFEVEIERGSNGQNQQDAIHRAERINYRWTKSDSLLCFMPSYSFGKGDKFRFQSIRIVVYVPNGKTVLLKPKTRRILHYVRNRSNTWDPEMAGHYWFMGEKGLESPDFPVNELDSY